MDLFDRKKGVSTILGTLIFIGILFTAVIPMQLVMQQADNIYEQEKLKRAQKDEEQGLENVGVTSYPNSSNPNKLFVRAENKGNVPVKIVRVWINDDYHTENATIESGKKKTLGPFTVSAVNDTYYDVSATTERGNSFDSHPGSLYYCDGTWYTPSLSISVYILNDQGQYNIKVENYTHQTLEDWYSGGIIHDDFLQSFEVPESGTYYVTVRKKVSGNWKELAISPATVTITWPDGSPIAYVYGDGDELK